MQRLKFLLAGCTMFVATTQAQESTTPEPNNWYLGMGSGLHSSWLHYSDLNKDVFPTNKNCNGGMFAVFAQGEFGGNHQYAIRPEVSYTHRGGRLFEIGSKLLDAGTLLPYYDVEGLKDVRYSLSAHYVDVRVPLMYQFLKPTSAVRPYVYVAPVLGFCAGGEINAAMQYVETKSSNSYIGYQMDLTKMNMNGVYFAAAVGAGVKWQLRIGRHTCYLGAELMYEHGLTNTYGKEKDGEATSVVLPEPLPQGRKVYGSRHLRGLELRANIGIPFSVFKKKHAPTPVVEVFEPAIPEPQPAPVVVKEEKPCYSLEEITDMMSRGESVSGKTICAIDDAINFDFGKSNIKSESYSYLNTLAETLIRTNSKIKIKGHTDNRGTEEFNMNLSRERAISVMQYLVQRGVSPDKLSYEAYGMSKPLTENDTDEGRRLNRRVEFEILK